jgi:hypothetical protein
MHFVFPLHHGRGKGARGSIASCHYATGRMVASFILNVIEFFI